MVSEAEFLARVSARLGRRSPAAAPPPLPPSRFAANPGAADGETLARLFAEELVRLGGHAHWAASPAAVAPQVVAILREAGLRGSVVRWEDPTLAGLSLDEALLAAGYAVVPFRPGADGRQLVGAAAQAVAGITGCDAAIAETGTLVLASHSPGRAGTPGRGRVVGLLPPVHIAVVRREQLVYSAVSVFRGLSAGALPPQVIFASGPSRSADIENDLSIGVHGPGRVHAIIL